MIALREYLLGITAAALICAILTAILQDQKYKTLLKLLCSIFMTLSIVSPLLDFRMDALEFDGNFVSAQAYSIVEEGSMAAKKAMEAAVAEQTADCIGQKAALLSAEITARVILEEETLVPIAVELCGAVSPYAKQQLSQWICEELGISKEAQRWES